MSAYRGVPTHLNLASFLNPKMPTGMCVYRNKGVELKLLKKCVAREWVLFR